MGEPGMTPGSLLLAPRSSPVAIASACWAVYVENNGRWQMAAHQSGRSPAGGEGDVEVQDPDNNAVYRQSPPLSAAGRFIGTSNFHGPHALGNISFTSPPLKLTA